MAIISGTQTAYDIKGIREDLLDSIYNISPDETPFLTMAGRAKAESTLHEWQTDSLAAADAANAQLDGNDYTFTIPSSTTRVGNYTQISAKTAIVSGTVQSVNKAGRKDEMAYQLAKRSAELKIDMETIMLGTAQGGVAGGTGTARKTASMLAWVKTNSDKGATGVDPNWTSGVPAAANIRTDGTQRALTETILKSVIQKCWTAGANPKYVFVGAANKQLISTFSGVATKTFYQSATGPSKIIGAADVYVSDFGVLNIIPARNQRARDGWVLDFSMLKVAYLRPFVTEELAKTGDADKKLLLVEYALQVNNEASQGICADLS